MPEYLSPGVYMEEVSFRSKSIEGVPTSTTGVAGMTRFGPVQYAGGPSTTEPRLITSFTEFERVYGGLEQLFVDRGDGQPTSESYLAHAVRMFFLNGGKRMYVSRVFAEGADNGVAHLDLSFRGGADSANWTARWPGRYGNVLLTVRASRKGNVAYDHTAAPGFGIQARGLTRGAVVEITPPLGVPLGANDPLDTSRLAVVDVDDSALDVHGTPQQSFHDAAGAPIAVAAGSIIKEVVLQVAIVAGVDRVDVYGELATHPAQRRWIGKILERDDPEDENAVLWLDTDAPDDPAAPLDLGRAIDLMVAIETGPEGVRLRAAMTAWSPSRTTSSVTTPIPTTPTQKATGLQALGEIDDIAIVALPDGGTYDDPVLCRSAADHADRARRAAPLPDRRRRRTEGQFDERDPRVPRAVRHDVRRAVPPVDRDPRPARAARSGGAAAPGPAAAVGFRWPASTPAATSSGACSRRRPTRSCAA